MIGRTAENIVILTILASVGKPDEFVLCDTKAGAMREGLKFLEQMKLAEQNSEGEDKYPHGFASQELDLEIFEIEMQHFCNCKNE